MVHDPLRSLKNELDDESGDTSRDRFESRLVEQLLTAFKLQKHRTVLHNYCRELFGSPSLTFSAFEETFPSFPFTMHARLLPYVSKNNPVAKLLTGFSTSQLQREFSEAADSSGDSGKHTALICRWPTISHGLVVHNGPLDTAVSGSRFYWTNGRFHAVVESWTAFINSLKKTWNPSS